MKKIALLSIMMIMIVTLAGCKKGTLTIKTSSVSENTMLIKKDGRVQVAIVDTFDKSYYSVDEIDSYIKDELTKFNQTVNNNDAIKLVDLEKVKDNIVMVLEYQTFDYYTQFNKVEGNYYSTLTSEVQSKLPQILFNTKDEAIQGSEVTFEENYKVVELKEEYNLMIDGKIKYYNNGERSDNNQIKSQASGTVVVFE